MLFDCIAKPDAAGWDLARVVDSAAWTAYPGGAPANVACALVKLGVPASFVGAVGRDSEGEVETRPPKKKKEGLVTSDWLCCLLR